MMLLLDSALRSLVLGLLVWALLMSLRVRDSTTETIIWTAVLIIALSMPLLSHSLPRMLVTVPHLSSQHSRAASGLAGTAGTSLAVSWFARRQTFLLGAYALGFLVCVTRLAIGLLRTVRLYVRSVPAEAYWAGGHHIRVSAALKSPVSLGHIILVPADYREWGAAKRDAVLAHEETHIARGDFFVQLTASLHCTLFWFSPFAWWLRSKLSEIAETASDEAAVERLNDRVTYAEILLEVACGTQPSLSSVAMAKGPFIQRRVERILSEAPSQKLRAPLRVFLVGLLPVMAFTLASAKAALTPNPSSARVEQASPVKREGKASAPSKSSAGPDAAHHIQQRVGRPVLHVPGSEPTGQSEHEETSYNPRALLDPVYIPPRPFVPAPTIVHAGKIFYLPSTERPIAEVSAADEIYRGRN